MVKAAGRARRQRGRALEARKTWERHGHLRSRAQARLSGGFTPLLYAARKGCRR